VRGWRRIIFYEDPRLSGEDAFKYFEHDNFYGMPMDYLPTLEQWMTISSANGYLYADNIFGILLFSVIGNVWLPMSLEHICSVRI